MTVACGTAQDRRLLLQHRFLNSVDVEGRVLLLPKRLEVGEDIVVGVGAKGIPQQPRELVEPMRVIGQAEVAANGPVMRANVRDDHPRVFPPSPGVFVSVRDVADVHLVVEDDLVRVVVDVQDGGLDVSDVLALRAVFKLSWRDRCRDLMALMLHDLRCSRCCSWGPCRGPGCSRSSDGR